MLEINVWSLSRVQPFVAHKAPLSIEFFRQEYWSGLSFPSPGDLPDPGIEPESSTLQADYQRSHQGTEIEIECKTNGLHLKHPKTFPHPSVKKSSSKKTPKVKERTSSVLDCSRLLA